jgi:hypothetical protein
MEGNKKKHKSAPSLVSNSSHHQVLYISFQELFMQVYAHPFVFYCANDDAHSCVLCFNSGQHFIINSIGLSYLVTNIIIFIT